MKNMNFQIFEFSRIHMHFEVHVCNLGNFGGHIRDQRKKLVQNTLNLEFWIFESFSPKLNASPLHVSRNRPFLLEKWRFFNISLTFRILNRFSIFFLQFVEEELILQAGEGSIKKYKIFFIELIVKVLNRHLRVEKKKFLKIFAWFFYFFLWNYLFLLELYRTDE